MGGRTIGHNASIQAGCLDLAIAQGGPAGQRKYSGRGNSAIGQAELLTERGRSPVGGLDVDGVVFGLRQGETLCLPPVVGGNGGLALASESIGPLQQANQAAKTNGSSQASSAGGTTGWE